MVRRWRYLVLGGVAIAATVVIYLYRQDLGLSGLRGGDSGSAPQTDQGAPPARPARINWQTVNRPQDGFRVEMPIDPKEIKLPAYNEKGGTELINMIFSNPDASTTFAVSWADNPPVARAGNRSPDRTLNLARDGALASTQTALVNETASSPGGSPARDIVAHNQGGGVMDSRMLYVGSRLYMLTAAFPSMSARRQQDVTRFFNSFKAADLADIPVNLPAASPTDANN